MSSWLTPISGCDNNFLLKSPFPEENGGIFYVILDILICLIGEIFYSSSTSIIVLALHLKQSRDGYRWANYQCCVCCLRL